MIHATSIHATFSDYFRFWISVPGLADCVMPDAFGVEDASSRFWISSILVLLFCSFVFLLLFLFLLRLAGKDLALHLLAIDLPVFHFVVVVHKLAFKLCNEVGNLISGQWRIKFELVKKLEGCRVMLDRFFARLFLLLATLPTLFLGWRKIK